MEKAGINFSVQWAGVEEVPEIKVVLPPQAPSQILLSGGRTDYPIGLRNLGKRPVRFTELVLDSGSTKVSASLSRTLLVIEPGNTEQLVLQFEPNEALTSDDKGSATLRGVES